MTVYFTASIVGKKHYLAKYLAIIHYLKSKNYEVTSDHIINSTSSQIISENKDERIRFQNRLEKWISESDFMIAETSFPSISVGYEISLALQENKPVLVLYSEGDPPSLLIHHRDENLDCEKYMLSTLPEIIDNFVKYVEGAVDARFTFFITSEIASYLDKVSKKEKVPKSVYLRKLIEREMKTRR